MTSITLGCEDSWPPSSDLQTIVAEYIGRFDRIGWVQDDAAIALD